MKKFLETIKTLKKTPRGKALLFFACYFLFFIIVLIVFRFGVKKPIGKYEYEKGIKNSVNLDINLTNYTYKYEINLDNNISTFTGKRNNNKEQFNYLDKEYLKVDNNYFINDNNLWLKTANPNTFSYFTDTTNLEKLIESAYLLSKTDYESGKVVYNYLISTNEIEKYYKNINIDIAEIPNEIVISADEEENINEIKLKLNSFCLYEKTCTNTLEITLNYENFNQVEQIEAVGD